jgi:pimeloyl-ACP methyl ester carboxylesterase
VSSITTDQGIVHYEVYGRGRPVILLHGWLGSWGLWQETMNYLGKYYRTYALDFWGFGESGKKRESYAIQDFVSLVDQFMDALGIERALLVGHSMGGTVSLSVAVQYPHRVSKIVVVGSPIKGSSVALLLKLIGLRPVAEVLFNVMWAFRIGVHFYSRLACSDPRYPAMMDKDLTRTTVEAFLSSIGSLRRTDLCPVLPEVKVPVLGMYGEKDIVVHRDQWKVLQDGIPHARVERFRNAGHFIMLDDPDAFRNTLKGFLAEGSNAPEVPSSTY